MKIVLLGPYNSGKSTTVQKICKGSAISIDYGGTTVALDHCRTQIYGVEIFLFGTPGLQRFEIIRKILSKGADGILFVVDSVNVASFEEAKKLLKEAYDILPGVPIVLCANKQDIRGAKSPNEVADVVLGKNKDKISVIGTSATTGEQIEHALGLIVLNAIKQYYDILLAVKKSNGELAEIAKNIQQPEEKVYSQLQFASWRRLIVADWSSLRFTLTKGVSKITDILEFGHKQI
ncbi:MAG: GTP-binding protein [Candidatus Heimdallarchaeota archaeon]|nr:MAG: GTP-binding protein [Candidatus Heimdallarchaeota archaeon]